VAFLDVGQGDSTVVVDHDSRTAMLIDCPRGAEGIAIAEIETHDAELDTVLVTHSHLDHLGGILDAIEALGCRRLLYNHDTLIAQPAVTTTGTRARPDPAVRASLRRILELRDDQLGPAIAGTTGWVGAAQYSLLAPSHRDLTRAVVTRRANAGSGVVVIEVDGVRVLVGGDADGHAWARLLRLGALGHVQAARWPHHGADLAAEWPGLTEELLDELSADVVAVSVGSDNTYGHPSDSFLDAIRPRASTLMCTEATAKCAPGNLQPCAGAVRVRIVGGAIQVEPSIANHHSRVQLLATPSCIE
jgi:competence protein ComEC